MHQKLKTLGFVNIQILDDKTEIKIANLSIFLIPPLNITGLESNADTNTQPIDAGYLFVNDETKLRLAFLGDNSLYSEECVEQYKYLLEKLDLIAFAYSGFSSDYPFNYGFNHGDMLDICNQGEQQRFTKQLNNLIKIRPRFVLPYLSEFVPIGSHAANWMKCFKKVWTNNKDLVAKKYGESLNCAFGTLYPNEFLKFVNKKPQPIKTQFPRKQYLQMASEYYEKNTNLLKLTEATKTILRLIDQIIFYCAENFFESIVRLELKPNFSFNFFVEEKFQIGLNTRTMKVSYNEIKKQRISLYIDANLFLKVLKGSLHWNDACLSLRMNWRREPNIFDIHSYNALHYFRLPYDHK